MILEERFLREHAGEVTHRVLQKAGKAGKAKLPSKKMFSKRKSRKAVRNTVLSPGRVSQGRCAQAAHRLIRKRSLNEEMTAVTTALRTGCSCRMAHIPGPAKEQEQRKQSAMFAF